MKTHEALAYTREVPFLMRFQEECANPLKVEGSYSEDLRMWVGNPSMLIVANTTTQDHTHYTTQGNDRGIQTDTYNDDDE